MQDINVSVVSLNCKQDQKKHNLEKSNHEVSKTQRKKI